MIAVPKIKKVVTKANIFYIRSGKQDQVRLRPTLAGSEVLTDTTKAQLLGKRQVIDVWVTYFNAVSERELKEAEGATPGSSHGTTEGSSAKVMLPTLAELSQARANISTPRRLKLGEMLLTFSETLPAPLGGFEKIEELSDNMDVDPMDTDCRKWGRNGRRW
jgi:hypothetical protein